MNSDEEIPSIWGANVWEEVPRMMCTEKSMQSPAPDFLKKY